MKASDIPSAASTALPPSPALPSAPAVSQASTDAFSDIMGRALASKTPDTSAEDSSSSDGETSSPKSDKSADQSTTPNLEILAALAVPAMLPPQATATVSAAAASGEGIVPTVGEVSADSKGETISALARGTAESNSTANSANANANADGTKTIAIPTAALAAPGTRADDAKANLPVTRQEIPISSLADSLRPLDNSKISNTTPVAPVVQPSPTWTTSTDAGSGIDVQNVSTPQLGTEPAVQPPSSPPVSLVDAPATSSEVAEQKLPVEVKSVSTSATELNSETPVQPLENSRGMRVLGKAEPAGTSGAKYASPMQKADKMNDFTGSTEQNLPVTATATGASISVKPAKAASSIFESSSEASVAVGSSFSATDGANGMDARVDQIFPNTAARAVERAHDIMALHAMRLRDSGRDSMQIVIKPSPDLHLALNLQNRDGVVEVTAQLQRGDYEVLNRHWADLQQQMEARGVRLAPLNQNQTPGNSSGNASSQSRQNPEDKTTRDGAFAEFALSGVLVPKRAATKTTAPRGWESWA